MLDYITAKQYMTSTGNKHQSYIHVTMRHVVAGEKINVCKELSSKGNIHFLFGRAYGKRSNNLGNA